MIDYNPEPVEPLSFQRHIYVYNCRYMIDYNPEQVEPLSYL